MSTSILKRYLPRGLYGRAMLILLLPVITVSLVVLVVFVQRHFEGVTRQMTISVAREVRMALDNPSATTEQIAASRAAQVLQIKVLSVDPRNVPTQDFRTWYDLTGGFVTRELNRLLPLARAVHLPDERLVQLYFDRPDGPILMEFDRRRVSAANPHQLIVNMLFFGVLVTCVSYFYLRNQLRPITRLARAAAAFGRGRSMPYTPSGATEVREAGTAFVDMRARIERQIEQRTLLLSGVSHDLRTPLTRLKLGLSMLDSADVAPLQRDVQDMEHLLDEFLAFARGAQEVAPHLVDVVDFVTAITRDAKRANFDVSLHKTTGSGRVMLRETALRRAMDNLISNAVRYGNRAELSMVLDATSLRLIVEDDGPGIPKEDREEALKPFVRLEPARNQNLGTGVGLGLSIALDVVRAHGGQLMLDESQRLGGLKAEILIDL